jgi:acetylornithine deacetylase
VSSGLLRFVGEGSDRSTASPYLDSGRYGVYFDIKIACGFGARIAPFGGTPVSDATAFGDRLDALVDRSHLTRMILDMIDIPTPTGSEEVFARHLGERFGELGMEITYQEVEPGRPNMIARLRGTGGGPSLMFNGHMDTTMVGDEPGLQIGQRNRPGIVDDEWVYGNGCSNMKGAFPAYYAAIKAIQGADVQLKGDIIVAGVVGEIEKAPIDQYQGCEFRGGGVGSRWLVMQGVTSDVAIIGEPTGMRLQPGNTGYLFAKLSTLGVTQHTWCKQNAVDALKKMRPLIDRLEEWEPTYQARHPHPFMMPRINIAAIQGGFPFKPSLSAPYCFLYVHVTMVPKTDINGVRQEMQQILDELAAEDPDFHGAIEIYLARNGYEIAMDHPLVGLVSNAHRAVLSDDPVFPEPNRYSVSSDGATLDEYGIASVTYGPGGINRQRQYQQYDKELGEILSVTNLVDTSKVYAQAAVELCSKSREEWVKETATFQPFRA